MESSAASLVCVGCALNRMRGRSLVLRCEPWRLPRWYPRAGCRV